MTPQPFVHAPVVSASVPADGDQLPISPPSAKSAAVVEVAPAPPAAPPAVAPVAPVVPVAVAPVVPVAPVTQPVVHAPVVSESVPAAVPPISAKAADVAGKDASAPVLELGNAGTVPRAPLAPLVASEPDSILAWGVRVSVAMALVAVLFFGMLGLAYGTGGMHAVCLHVLTVACKQGGMGIGLARSPSLFRCRRSCSIGAG